MTKQDFDITIRTAEVPVKETLKSDPKLIPKLKDKPPDSSIVSNPSSHRASESASIDGFLISVYPNSQPHLGVIFAVLHVFSYCGIASFVKVIKHSQPDIESSHILIFRGFFQLFILYPIAEYYGSPMIYSKGHTTLLLIRSVCGWANAFCIYRAYQLIQLGTASSIQSTSPVMVFLLSYCLLGEQMDYIKWLAPILSIIGTVFITEPSFLFDTDKDEGKDDHFAGVFYSFLSAFSVAGAIVFLRKLKECSTILVLVWYSIACIIISVILLTYNNTWMIDIELKIYGYLFVVSIFGLSSQTFMTLSLKYTKASMVSIIRSLTIVVNFIIDFLAFDHKFRLLPVIGSVFIFVAVAILAIHDHYIKDDDKMDTEKTADKELPKEVNNINNQNNKKKKEKKKEPIQMVSTEESKESVIKSASAKKIPDGGKSKFYSAGSAQLESSTGSRTAETSKSSHI